MLKANFSATPISGESPLRVQFTDLSTGNPVSWQWNFQDGSGSNEPNPVHVFENVNAGTIQTFQVLLVVANASGTDHTTRSITTTNNYTPPPNPETDSAAWVAVVCVLLVVLFLGIIYVAWPFYVYVYNSTRRNSKNYE
jgi:PKD repeat protein